MWTSCGSVAATESVVAMVTHAHGVILAVPMWTYHAILQNLHGLLLCEVMYFE